MKSRARERLAGVGFASPYLLGLAVILAGPLAISFVLSLTDYDGVGRLTSANWVGLANYRRALGGADELFAKALANTLIYTAAAVPLQLVAALALATLLNRRLPGQSIFRTVLYLPHVVAGVATVMMWQWMFNPDLGLINSALRSVGVATGEHRMLQWLYSPSGAKPALILMSLWSVGGQMLIFLAALQNVPEHLHEAAMVDGAGPWRRWRHVTVPQISPAVFFNLVMGLIFSMQIFTQPFLLYTPQQDNALLMLVVHLYYEAFQFGRFGYASAIAWILTAILLVLTALVLASGRWWVYYESES
jgi:multiple sugar transport system permease protein